jgi:DNA ligase 1
MSLIKMFPTLYQKNSKGKIKVWTVSVQDLGSAGPVICVVVDHGVEGGKIQNVHTIVKSGKNIGKANETTIEEQARLDAQSKWTKQQEREGYKEDRTKLDIDERPGIEPMLAHRFDKYPSKIEFPALIQRKLNGHRMTAKIENGVCTLWSRKRTQILGFPHIVKALETQFKDHPDVLKLDGEAYKHGMPLEKISSYARSKTPVEGHEQVEYHIYDLIDYEMPQALRVKTLEYLLFLTEKPLVQVETTIVRQDRVTPLFDLFRKEGYEGAILRNLNGIYIGDRSYDLQKVKECEDGEFKIIGVTEGKQGTVVFECVTPYGQTFEAAKTGDKNGNQKYLNRPQDYIGKMLTVEYRGWTEKGKPNHAVGTGIRDDI